ncbi:sodium:proton antiporter [Estrella lausannensis]|uniref:Na+/H+ exchange protein n=1 Tax=Estrella lausannensis TaxID=483423 RepID=A0A0H5DQ98_9BACT|nr:sodium:proton antiporter [Estrella lausannensis]CRX37714.1 Na+/H+ exchange protein [Estrella lausannensis]
MKKVLIYSVLLILGLIGSQVLGGKGKDVIDLITLWCLSFIMIHVGNEFDIDKNNPRQYAWDYLVAGTAAAFPWIFCAAYFVWVLNTDSWKDALVLARFSSPTSAGVLFSMLAAAGLSATWVFRKARVLAIFDDLDTILLMIPLKMLMVGMRWELMVNLVVIVVLLFLAWRYMHKLEWPTSYPWVLLYAGVIAGVCELVYYTTSIFEDVMPIHLEVLLPAFVLGCMMKRSEAHSDEPGGHEEGHSHESEEQRVAGIITGTFMVFVGLSMPVINTDGMSWNTLLIHVLLITLVSNLGKMFPMFCYRDEAPLKERLALSISMFPRGEVGAGVLVASMGYGLGGTALIVAVLSLALNLVLTGLFIIGVQELIKERA